MIAEANEYRKKKKLAEAQQNYLDALEESRRSSSPSRGQSTTAASSAAPCQNEPFVPWMPQVAVSPMRPSRAATAAQHTPEEEIFNIDDLINTPPEPAHAPLPAVPQAPVLHAQAVPPAPIAHAPVVPPAHIVHAPDGPAPAEFCDVCGARMLPPWTNRRDGSRFRRCSRWFAQGADKCHFKRDAD
jgi:hypothetical protein